MVVSMRDGMKGSALGGRGWFGLRGTCARCCGWSATQPRSGGWGVALAVSGRRSLVRGTAGFHRAGCGSRIWGPADRAGDIAHSSGRSLRASASSAPSAVFVPARSHFQLCVSPAVGLLLQAEAEDVLAVIEAAFEFAALVGLFFLGVGANDAARWGGPIWRAPQMRRSHGRGPWARPPRTRASDRGTRPRTRKWFRYERGPSGKAGRSVGNRI